MTQTGERSARMSLDELAQLHTALEQAPEIPTPEPAGYSMNQVIQVVYSALVTMKQRGYRIEDICEFIERRSGYAIKPNTLAKYMSQERQRRRRQCKRRRSSTASAGRRSSRSKRTKKTASVPSQTLADLPLSAPKTPEPAEEPTSAQPEPEALHPVVSADPEVHHRDAQASDIDVPETAARSCSASQSFFEQLSKNAETFHRPRNPNALKSEPSIDDS